MRSAIRIGGVLLMLLASGCFGKGTTQPTRFFTLHPVASTLAPSPPDGARKLVIGVGPTRFPQYLRRPQIATLRSQGEYRLADFCRWGEPLADNFERTLAENLESRIGTSHLVLFPWRSTVPIDYQVSMDVLRFDSGPDDRTRLRVSWIVLGGGNRELLLMRHSQVEVPLHGDDTPGVVEGMSRALAEFSREVAGAIGELRAKERTAREDSAGGEPGE